MRVRFLATAVLLMGALVGQDAEAKKEPPQISLTEVLPPHFKDSLVPFEEGASFEDRWSWIDGKHIYVTAVMAQARVGVLSIPLQSQSDALEERVVQTVRDAGYTVVTENSYVEKGLMGKAVFRAWGWAKVEANKEIVEERLAMWREKSPLPSDWWSDALLSAGAPFIETDVLADWVKDVEVCRAVGGGWLYDELLTRDGEEGAEVLIKVLKFHSHACPRERSAMALIAGGHEAAVEEQLPSLPEAVQAKVRKALMEQ